MLKIESGNELQTDGQMNRLLDAQKLILDAQTLILVAQTLIVDAQTLILCAHDPLIFEQRV